MSSAPVDLPLSPAAIDSAIAADPVPEDVSPHRWSGLTRIAFRFSFCYFGIYCLCNGNATVWDCIPGVGNSVQDVLARVFLLPAQYLAQHLFHVAPPGDKIHATGSGDTAINWIAILLMLVVSLLGSVIWTALDRRRLHYQTLAAWLRFVIRLTLGLGMVTYGLDKVFPVQMSPPSIASLNEPLGMHSPMNLLWGFIGLNPGYEMVCGGAEFLAGCLILLRRTALAGAMLTAFVVTNVLLFNLFFDVPVKIYAGHLLLLSLFVILPDAGALVRFFWSHQQAAPTGIWVPPGTRTWFRRTTLAIEISFVAIAIGGGLEGNLRYWREAEVRRSAPCPLCGAWRIDSATVPDASGHAVPHSLASVDGSPAVGLDISYPNGGSLTNMYGYASDIALSKVSSQTLEIDGPNKTVLYSVARPDSTHMVLTPTAAAAGTNATLTLTLLTPPGGYPLTHRGFHWISEYPFQR